MRQTTPVLMSNRVSSEHICQMLLYIVTDSQFSGYIVQKNESWNNGNPME